MYLWMFKFTVNPPISPLGAYIFLGFLHGGSFGGGGLIRGGLIRGFTVVHNLCYVCGEGVFHTTRNSSTCPDRTYVFPHMLKIHSTSDYSPVPTSLSTVPLHMPNRNSVVANATLVTVTFCFHISALPCSFLNETFERSEWFSNRKLYFGCTNLGSHVQFQIVQSYRSCRQVRACEFALWHQLLPSMD